MHKAKNLRYRKLKESIFYIKDSRLFFTGRISFTPYNLLNLLTYGLSNNLITGDMSFIMLNLCTDPSCLHRIQRLWTTPNSRFSFSAIQQMPVFPRETAFLFNNKLSGTFAARAQNRSGKNRSPRNFAWDVIFNGCISVKNSTLLPPKMNFQSLTNNFCASVFPLS